MKGLSPFSPLNHLQGDCPFLIRVVLTQRSYKDPSALNDLLNELVLNSQSFNDCLNRFFGL